MNISELFTWESLGTLGGGSLAITLVTNVVGSLVKIDAARKWIAFLLAIALAIALTATQANPSLTTWVIGILNGFLLYSTAIGLNQLGTGVTGGGGAGGGGPAPETPGERRAGGGSGRFFRSWV